MVQNQARKIFSTIVTVLNNLAAGLIFIIAGWIVLDVAGRVIFNHPLVGTPEIAANSIAAIAFLQMPKVLREGRHIRSEMVWTKMGPIGREWIEIISSVLGIVLFVLAFVSNWEPTVASWVLGEYEGEGGLRVPSYPVKTVIQIACVLMTIQFGMNLVASINRLRTGKESKD